VRGGGGLFVVVGPHAWPAVVRGLHSSHSSLSVFTIQMRADIAAICTVYFLLSTL